MAANIGEIRAGVIGTDGRHGRIQDKDSKLSTTPDLTCDVDMAILSAKEQYEKVRPREVTLKLDGTGAFDYAIAGLTGFVLGSSSILAVRYPYVTTEQIPVPLDKEQYAIYQTDTGAVLRFLLHRPSAVEDFLVTFTTPHVLNVTTSTIPAADDQALMDLAAANCCDMLAALYTKDLDQSINADSVDRRGKPDLYRSLAASYRRLWDTKMQTGSAQQAAVVMTDIDRQGFGHMGRIAHFFHGH